jgi:putative ABC transport system permease protein
MREWAHEISLRLKALLLRRRLDRDLDDELQFHLAMREEKYRAEGAGAPSEIAARAAARRQFGNMTSLKEACREMWTFASLEAFWQDVRFGLRMLRRSPGFTLIAVLTLALGIGANTAIFSVIDGVLLRPLPYKNPEQLIAITTANLDKSIRGLAVSFTKLTLIKQQSRTLQSTGAFIATSSSLTTRGTPEQINAVLSTRDLFNVLDVSPAEGRGFLPEEDQPGGADVAILSDGFWHSHFGGDPSIVGRTIPLDGRSVNVIGVLPASFRFPFQQPEPDVWFPRVFDFPSLAPVRIRTGASYLTVFARLKPGTSLTQAQAEFDALNSAYSHDNQGFVDGAKYTLDATSLSDNLVGGLRPPLIVLLTAVGFVLLIGCANVASLLLARATAREREIAIRRALGASRARLVRQLLTESLLLSFLGGGLGVCLAARALRLPRLLPPGTIPRLEEVRVNGAVLLFSVGICLLTGIAFGVMPSLHASHKNLHDTLKEGGRGSTEGGAVGRSRAALVIAEVAVALVLVTGAGLLIRSFTRLLHVNAGFEAAHVMTFSMSLPQTHYPQPAQQAEFYRRLVEGAENLPGVESAALVSHLPLATPTRFVFFCPEGTVCQGIGKDPIIAIRYISPDYFRTMRIPLLSGRTFTSIDVTSAKPVVLINETAAKLYFPNQGAVGKHLSQTRDMIPMEIIGVVKDVKFSALNGPPANEMYLLHQQSPWASMTLVIRSASNPQPMVAAVRQIIHGIDSDLPLSNVSTMDEVVSASVAQPRLITQLVASFAVLALLLAAIGIYGVMAYSVTQRTHEVGIRLALGAQPRDVLALLMGHGMRLVFLGVALGVVVSLALTRLLATLLYGTSVRDPLTFAGVSVLLVAVALLACYVPARRAMRVDPIVALRYE